MGKLITITFDYDGNYAQYDLDSLFQYATDCPFALPAKVRLYACVMGENDEASWYWIFKHDGKFYFATGGCDYTGWDCRSWGHVEEASTLTAAVNMAPEKEDYYDRYPRRWLKAQIAGKLQVGVVDSL